MPFRVMLFTVRPSGAHTKALEALVDGYLQRCGPLFQAEAKSFRSSTLLLAATAEQQKRDAAVLWLADGGGGALSSTAFADRIKQARESGRRALLMAIGPANGWTDQARAQADLRVSLGPMTLPHELAALVLAEQIYRASTILQGHPYHLGH